MPRGGQNAKPLAVLQLEGGFQHNKKRYVGRGPSLGGEALRKPDDLPDRAGWLWDQVTLHRSAWLCGSDAPALEMLCRSFAYMRECDKVLEKNPLDKDARCARATYFGEVNSLGARFGLTPSDRARLGEDKPLRDEQEEMKGMMA